MIDLRHQRQILLPQIGAAGQFKLAGARVLIVGCGALGTTIADQLARAGVGFLRIVDRDIVELSNLHRQTLFDESDAASALPKAIAAARRLAAINSGVQVDPHVADVNPLNVADLATDVDLILDGTDNVATRYLLNDLAVRDGIPWVYGAAVAVVGRMLAINPGQTPCLRCIFPTPPTPGELPTCDTAGVLGAVPAIVGALQATAAIKILVGQGAAAFGFLHHLDVWANRFHVADARDARRVDCPCCAGRRFEFLDARPSESAVSLCGRNAIQIAPARPTQLNLPELATRLSAVAVVHRSEYRLRCDFADGVTLTIFPDARALIHNLPDPARCRSLYARYIGA